MLMWILNGLLDMFIVSFWLVAEFIAWLILLVNTILVIYIVIVSRKEIVKFFQFIIDMIK